MDSVETASSPEPLSVAWTSQTCGCPICAGAPQTSLGDTNQNALADSAAAPGFTDVAGIPQLDAQGFLLDPSHPASGLIGTTLNGKPVWSAYQTAAHIDRVGATWADYGAPGLTVSYSFGNDVTLPSGYEAFASTMSQDGALRAMQLYTDVSGLTFFESAAGETADITFMFGIGSTNGGGWADFPFSGGGYVQVGHVSWEPTMDPGTYSLRLLLHELGHGVGLNHPGSYNGSVTDSQVDHFNDSYQYTNMSYLSGSTTGASLSHLATLGLHDTLAVQMLYGVNWSTRNTDTTYGFHSTAGSNSYDFNFDSTMGFCIWDGGGIDTLDFSGFSGATVLDLREGGFSSTGLERYNVSIAYNAVVENGIGGSGNDKMRGNAVANQLDGGAGNDTIYGGEETALLPSADPRDFIGIQLNENPLVHDQYLGIAGITSFSGAAFTWEQLVKLTRAPNDAIEFASYNVSGNDNQFIFEGNTNGVLQVTIANKTTFDTTIKTETLIDGNPHRLSLSWDKASGTLTIYVDGQQQFTGVYTDAIGATIGAGGTLVIGQEQDTPGGGFSQYQLLQGAVGDIRIFNDIRTAQEVADNAFTRLTGSEQGLVNNWQVKASDTLTVSDVAVANPAVNLTDLLPSGSFIASQSSIYDVTTAASNILDNSVGTWSHTKNDDTVWLRLDFAATQAVEYIEITNRPSWASRLVGATVSVLDAAGAVLYTSDPITSTNSIIKILLPSVMSANAIQFDRVRPSAGVDNILNISEVNIFGHAPDGVTVPSELTNTDLTIYGGPAVVNTAPVVNLAPDTDTLIGGSGDDTLYGGAGADTLEGGIGLDSLNGGADFDFASYAHASGMITANLTAPGANAGEAVGDTYALVEGIIGSGFGDFIAGDAGANELRGMSGNDGIWGVGGADTLLGGDGNDTLFGGAGADRLDGGDQFDFASYYGAAAAITANMTTLGANAGEAVGDTYIAIEGIIGSNFADFIAGDGNANDLRGMGGTDGIWGAVGNDTLQGGDGNDVLIGGVGADRLDGGNQIDFASYYGATSGVTVNMLALSLNRGEAQGDTYLSIEGLIGTQSVDYLTGDNANNEVRGMGGNDGLWGAAGADTLQGGDGDDALFGGVGADSVVGGTGRDSFVFYALGEGGDHIVDFVLGTDRIQFVASTFGNGLVAGRDLAAAGIFVTNATGAATATSAQLIYNTSSGELSWDADGTGSVAAALLAILDTKPGLRSADIIIT